MSGVEQTTNTFNWIALGIMGTFIGVMFSIIIAIINLRNSNKIREEHTKLRFSEMLENFEHDFAEVVQRQFRSDSIETSIRSAKDMLNILQRLVYLRKLNKIDDNMINFFKRHFSNGYTLMNLFDKLFSPSNNEIYYKHIIWWVKEKNITPVEFEALPPKLYELYTISKSGKRLTFQNGKYGFHD